MFVPGLIAGTAAGFALLDCAAAEPIMPNWAAAMVMAAAPRKRRRSWLISSDIYLPSTQAAATIVPGSYLSAGGRLLTKLNSPSRPGSM